MPEDHDGESTRLLAAIVAASDDAIISKTLSGIVTSWNRAAERIFGYAEAEMIGQPIAVLATPDKIDEMPMILERVRRGERVDHQETIRRHKDGRTIEVSLTVSPILDGAGKIVGASKIARDLTGQRRVERRLRELEDEISHVSRLSEMGEMASAIIHEVSQPLTAATNYLAAARLLLGGADQPSANQPLSAMNNAATQITRAMEVMSRLRAFLKKGEIDRRLQPITSVVTEAVQLAMIGTRNSGVRIDLRLPPQLPSVAIDKVQIQQVVVNLVRNAVQAMEASPRRDLTISGEAAPTNVRIAVIDTGPGIASEIASRLFQPFVTTKSQGMGIGLSVSRSIIENHGGELAAEPNPEGGTIFHFSLPIAARPPRAA